MIVAECKRVYFNVHSFEDFGQVVVCIELGHERFEELVETQQSERVRVRCFFECEICACQAGLVTASIP